ncbi:MAG TPA: ABC transporter permease [Candidatus Sulfotelmatobacter sp.]|nr:ABC transporter permease [Candidatus Sulfotelmatobacter sp.]
MSGVMQDLRYALRQLRNKPGFTVIAVATLAMGIAASTAIFSAVDTILLRPLPYRQPNQLVLVTESLPDMSLDEIGVAAGEYIDYRDRNHSFSQVASYERSGFNLTGTDRPLRVNGAALSSSAFPLLGVSPELGRTFTEEESRYGAGQVVVLSHALWKNEFAGNKNILGKAVKLDEKSYTVIGVMPPSFRFPFDGAPLSEMADLWVPDTFEPYRLAPQNRTMEFGVGLIGRLKPGVSLGQAQQDVSNIATAFMKQYGYTGTIHVQPKAYAFAPYSVAKARPLLLLLILAVGCVLLISCANVANLLLARATERSREMAVRSTLGASPVRLMRQCLVESVLLSLFGAVAGVLLARLFVAGLKQFGPNNLPRLHDIALHPAALVFALVLSIAAAIFFGFVPAWRLSHAAPQESLKESSQIGPARGTQKLQNSVATIEIAAAVVLLIAGGLLLRSFSRLLNSPFGFDPSNTFVVRTLFDNARYPDPVKRQAVQKNLLESLRQLPGVEVVAAASHLPLSDARQIGFRLEHAAADDYHFAENSLVSPGYFRTMGIPLIKGRDFSDQDRPTSTNVAIVSEKLAHQFFRNVDPIGQRFQWGDRAYFTIIGVAADVHIAALDADPPPMIYDSMFQAESGASDRTAFVLRSSGSAQTLFREVQQRVWAVDKDLPVYNTTSMATLVSESLAQRRFTVLLLGAFGALAVTLAAIGLFGVISYLVNQRTREFGLRLALGAERKDIYRRVLFRAAIVGTRGCVLGLGLSFLASRFLEASLYHVSRFDAETILVVPLLLLSVAFFAASWPARRAAKVDPMVALRYE